MPLEKIKKETGIHGFRCVFTMGDGARKATGCVPGKKKSRPEAGS